MKSISGQSDKDFPGMLFVFYCLYPLDPDQVSSEVDYSVKVCWLRVRNSLGCTPV